MGQLGLLLVRGARGKGNMSSKVVLHASKRTVTGKKVRALRHQGHLPAVIYGSGLDATSITLDLRSTTKEMRSISSSTIVTINVDGEEYNALVRELSTPDGASYRTSIFSWR
jgi:ribosomal protein L25 (general stress protein Ctc)